MKCLYALSLVVLCGCSQSIDYHPTLTDPTPVARGSEASKTEVFGRDDVLEASGLSYGELPSSGNIAKIKWKVSVKNGLRLTREIIVEAIFLDVAGKAVVKSTGTKIIKAGETGDIERTFEMNQKDIVRIVRVEARVKG
jgi:hypothetical protein